MKSRIFFLCSGVVFGFILSRSGASDYNFIQGMFLFTNLQLYGIIGTAVAIGTPAFVLLKRWGKTANGQPLEFKTKPFNKGTILGGVLFGIGWSITGMCPAPIIVNIGEGKLYAIAAFGGTFLGAWIFGVLQPKLQARLEFRKN